MGNESRSHFVGKEDENIVPLLSREQLWFLNLSDIVLIWKDSQNLKH